MMASSTHHVKHRTVVVLGQQNDLSYCSEDTRKEHLL